MLSFAGLLRQLRGEAKLTQEELAQAAGLSLRAVSDLERGINRTARKDTATLLAGALDLAESLTAVFVKAARGRVPAEDVLTAMRSSGYPLAGAKPRLWNIPARNPAFVGREDLLAAVRERLQSGQTAVVQALYGMGGVGKTQLAAEYAHRFAGSYDMAWWINAEQSGLVENQIADLGDGLGCIPPGAGSEAVRAAVMGELRQHGRWLLIFDNATAPADVMSWLPGASGHVLITSRERGWEEVAAAVEVDVLARAESVEMLQRRVPGIAEADADRLAGELGDLPLAIAQAAGFMVGTAISADQYLRLLQTRAGQLLDRAVPGTYPQSLAAATALILDRLAGHDPAAVELASLCAFLAPEPIPEYLFTGAAGLLPASWHAGSRPAGLAADPGPSVPRQSLARVDHRGLQMHRLTQAILRDRLTPARAAAARRCTEAILAASDPGHPPDPGTWARWAAANAARARRRPGRHR